MKSHDKEFESIEFNDLSSKVESIWTRDLGPLLASVSTFEIVENKIINALEIIKR
ncbi:MAG: hypothetical protein KAR20_09265 [Candidatus Heimdallarchaeota archaeon]|nr:hypothetical protein [Candidatus Heimdallarchaeota archaeon]